MGTYEFWLLMGVYALHTVLVLGAAYLIMRAQNAFNARLHREVTGAIVMIEGKLNNAITAVREDIRKPELFSAVGEGIAKQTALTVRNSLAGMYGNLTKTVNGPARDPISKFFYVLTARNKGSAIKKVMMDGSGIPVSDSGSGGPPVFPTVENSETTNQSSGPPPNAERLRALDEFVRGQIESDPALQAKIDAKAKELGLA